MPVGADIGDTVALFDSFTQESIGKPVYSFIELVVGKSFLSVNDTGLRTIQLDAAIQKMID
jgi:hypothetical protein